jgi:type VI protein secretion system component VasK
VDILALTILAVIVVIAILIPFAGRVLSVQFSLRTMFWLIVSGAACVSMIVAWKEPWMLALGIFGLILLFCLIISSVARASVRATVRASETREEKGNPPHGSEPDG